jgi:hypothetical protein
MSPLEVRSGMPEGVKEGVEWRFEILQVSYDFSAVNTVRVVSRMQTAKTAGKTYME